MAKSIEDRKIIGTAFENMISFKDHPELYQAPYKPGGIVALVDQYDQNVIKYGGTDGKGGLVKRKLDLAGILADLDPMLKEFEKKTSELKADRLTVHNANVILVQTAGDTLAMANAEASKDPSKVVTKLNDFIKKLKVNSDQDKQGTDTKAKFDAGFVGGVQKMGQDWEKEAKAILSETKTLTAKGDALEGQISGLLKTNKDIAKNKQNNGLQAALTAFIAFFAKN